MTTASHVIAELESLVASLSNRCEKQSQLLSKRAEKETAEESKS